jgi:hypothetical protein
VLATIVRRQQNALYFTVVEHKRKKLAKWQLLTAMILELQHPYCQGLLATRYTIVTAVT